MASHSRSGLNPHQRQAFLAEHGYAPVEGSGKGGHVVWENAAMKEKGADAPEMPLNLRSNVAQKPWEIVLSTDPAKGTWDKISKQAAWCDNAVNGLVITADAGCDFNTSAADNNVRRQFRMNREDYCALQGWKKAMKDMMLGRSTAYPGPCPVQLKVK